MDIINNKGLIMFHEHREVVSIMKNEDKYFLKIFNKHNALDEEIMELVKALADQFKIENLKKEKLKLKDEIFSMILSYKKVN